MHFLYCKSVINIYFYSTITYLFPLWNTPISKQYAPGAQNVHLVLWRHFSSLLKKLMFFVAVMVLFLLVHYCCWITVAMLFSLFFLTLHRRYLQEYSALGTGGGIYHFRDQIVSGSPEAFFVLNADVCSAFPLTEMLSFQKEHGEPNSFVILGTTVRLNYLEMLLSNRTWKIEQSIRWSKTQKLLLCFIVVG